MCGISSYFKYEWVFPLKDKNGITITNDFQIFLNKSGRKPNNIWVDKGSEFYIRSMKLWVQDNDIEIYSTHNEGKSVVTEGFVRTLETKICKYMTSISKNVYIDKLDDLINKYNNTYHSTIKMKPVDGKSSTYIDFGKKIMKNILNLKLVTMKEPRNIKTILQKATFQISLKKFL